MIPGNKPIVLSVILFFIVCPFYLFSQKNNPLINSGELLKQGNALHDDKKYKEAIDLYTQISRSDTNYSDALYELAYSCYSDKQFQRGHQYALEGMSLHPDDYTRFALIDGNILDEMDSTQAALNLYTDAIKRNPNSAIIYFNRSLAFIKNKQIAEAKKDLQQCLLINPYYSSAHYYLGTLYYDEGNMVATMLAFKTYLLMAPEGRYLSTIIQKLNDIAKVTDDVLQAVKKYKPGKEDNFDMAQQILLSKIALDKQYKLKADVEDQIVRQVQVVDEKLEYNKNDKGFCMQYYVPFYIKTFKEDQFEPMVFTIFSGLDIKSIKDWIKRNKKEREAFAEEAGRYFSEIRSTRVLAATERKSAVTWYYFEQGKFVGKGEYKLKDGKKMLFGPWEFYHDNGLVSAKGVYNEEEQKMGIWEFYYANGQLKQKTNYKNDVEEGLSEGWFDNGNKWYSESFVAGKLEGTGTVYYYNGLLKNVIEFKAGEKNGLQKNYNSSGDLYSTQNFIADKLNGEIITYFSDGIIDDRLNYKDDKAVGTYKSYHKNGKLKKQGDFVDGKREGLWTSYYEDGTVEDKTTYAADEITGEFTEYHENGKLSSRGTYVKKKIDGLVEYFDDDGIKYEDGTYDRGKLREINFYDKKGNNIFNSTTRRGAANITFYTPDGIKQSEGYFDKEGLRQGKFTWYFPSGKISSETTYKDGQENGPSIDYYNNGQKKLERNYTDGDEDGYTKEYFSNGKVSYEGWVVKGNRQQHFIYYNYFGDVVQKVFYVDNDYSGYTEFIEPGNITSYEYKYKDGWLVATTQFDITGKRIISNNPMPKGECTVLYHHDNGKVAGTGTYKNYHLTGPYTAYYFDGSTRFTTYYKRNEKDSVYKEFYYGGAVRNEGRFKDGDKVGLWKDYYENGKIKDETNYKDGKITGLDIAYNMDGTYDKVISYKKNKLDGEFKFYGENNQLGGILYYKDDALLGYSYEDKTGKLLPMIPMKGGSGKVITYFKNGVKSAEIDFLDNSVQGVRKYFYTTGKPYVEGTREFGYDTGVKKVYYASGMLMKEENLVMGNFHGSRKTYFPNGKIEKEENYYNDDLHGTCKYYDMQGKLRQTRTYFYGTLLSVK